MADAVAQVARATGRTNRPGVIPVVTYPIVTGVVSTNPAMLKTTESGDVEIPALGSYTPVVGDRVMVVNVGGSQIVVGTTGEVAPTRQRGTGTATISTGDVSGSESVAFSPAFTETPFVALTVTGAANCAARLNTATASGFTFTVFRTDASTAPVDQMVTVWWWADL